jgi:hypothetical protein
LFGQTALIHRRKFSREGVKAKELELELEEEEQVEIEIEEGLGLELERELEAEVEIEIEIEIEAEAVKSEATRWIPAPSSSWRRMRNETKRSLFTPGFPPMRWATIWNGKLNALSITVRPKAGRLARW